MCMSLTTPTTVVQGAVGVMVSGNKNKITVTSQVAGRFQPTLPSSFQILIKLTSSKMCFHRSLLCTRIGFSSIVFVKLAKTPLVFTIAFRFCPVPTGAFGCDFVGWLVAMEKHGVFKRGKGLITKNMATIPRENGAPKIKPITLICAIMMMNTRKSR